MTINSTTERASNDVYPELVSGLQIEFGCEDVEAIAAHFLEAEAADFHWAAREMERHLGPYQGLDDDNLDLERVAVIGRLMGRWYVACVIVDGDGAVHDMLRLRHFESAWDADEAFANAR